MSALPHAIGFLFVPLIAIGAALGGWWLALPVLFATLAMTVLDALAGKGGEGGRTTAWHRRIPMAWVPVQAAILLGGLFWARTGWLTDREEVFLFIGIGFATGSAGIVHAHELMHQRNRLERRLGEALMVSVLYGHFVTEHLAVHHRFVGTPRDAATARYNESFYRYLARVIPGSFLSAWRVEARRLRATGRPVWHRANPFWRYLGGAALLLAVAHVIAGGWGVTLFAVQAATAVIILEQTNYVEHYGLVRRPLGAERYEPVAARHSWNANHRVTNWLFLNLQRHADHHLHPDRRFPELETFEPDVAPELPFSYPLMTALSLNPLAWRRVMNPRVRKWRAIHYPEQRIWLKGGWFGPPGEPVTTISA